MNKAEQLARVDEITKMVVDTLSKKGDDYANEDRLSNFKVVGKQCGLTPEKVCLVMISVKVTRLGNLLDSKQPVNESIDDSIKDLVGYVMLLDMLRAEKLMPTGLSVGQAKSVQEMVDASPFFQEFHSGRFDLSETLKKTAHLPHVPLNALYTRDQLKEALKVGKPQREYEVAKVDSVSTCPNCGSEKLFMTERKPLLGSTEYVCITCASKLLKFKL